MSCSVTFRLDLVGNSVEDEDEEKENDDDDESEGNKLVEDELHDKEFDDNEDNELDRPPPFTIFWKYVCAWDLTCTFVREFTTSATLVHFLPYMSRPWRNRSCSSCVQEPVFSFASQEQQAAADVDAMAVTAED